MTLRNLDLPYDATNSWNGYNHQGKIALWYAIQSITELWDASESKENNEKMLQEYFLELEHMEDFSIGKKTLSGKEYISIHQVKSRADTAINKYSEAILSLLTKIIHNPSIENAYLHVTQELNLSGKTFSDVVAQMVSSKSTDKYILEIKTKRTDPNFRRDFYVPKHGVTNLKAAVCHALLNKYPKEEKITKDNFDYALDAFLETVCYRRDELLDKGLSQIDKLSIFKYPDLPALGKTQGYCEVDRAQGLLMDAIKIYFSKVAPGIWKVNDKNFIDKMYLYLLGELDKYIVERQLNYPDYNAGIKDRTISFDKILGWLDEDMSTMGKTFYLYHLKDEFYKAMNYFCHRCTKKGDFCAQCHMIEAKNKIGSMSFETMEKFTFITKPTVSGNISMDNYARFASETGIVDPFSKGLREISAPFLETPCIPVAYYDAEHKQYALTAILQSGADEDTKEICTNILYNPNIYSLLMDCDVLISKDVASESIQNDAEIITNISLENFEHIVHCKDVKIICLDDCKNYLI